MQSNPRQPPNNDIDAKQGKSRDHPTRTKEKASKLLVATVLDEYSTRTPKDEIMYKEQSPHRRMSINNESIKAKTGEQSKQQRKPITMLFYFAATFKPNRKNPGPTFTNTRKHLRKDLGKTEIKLRSADTNTTPWK